MFETFDDRIQGKTHRIETYETNKISFSCFDDEIYTSREEKIPKEKKKRNSLFEWVAKKVMKCGIKECESTNCFRECGIKDCNPSIFCEMWK